MKKGFTLIELLAVILILGIIALIAIPTVNNILKEARRGAFSSTLTNLEKAIENECTLNQIKNNDINYTYTITDGIISPSVEIKGDLPDGTIYVDGECKVNYTLYNNNFSAVKDDEVVIEDKKIYTESILNGAVPVLSNNLIPVTIDNDGTVRKADIYSKWYSYEEKIWANAVILTDAGKVEDDGVILEDSIESYFVWIPRYKYKLFDMGNYESYIEGKPTESNSKTIEIVFENKNNPVSVGTSVGEYHSHPAFQAFDTNGLWVGKFEFTGDINNVQTKPNQKVIRGYNVKTLFEISLNYKKTNFSHMIKNTEWGAIAYLSLSNYGINKEVNINNYNSSRVTGYSATSTADQSTYPGTASSNETYTQPYNTEIGYLASTTGNITGIYDMSGGTHEYIAAYKNGFLGSSGFDIDPVSIYGNRYFDVYSGDDTIISYKKRILGDATGELGPFYYYSHNTTSVIHNSWWNDSAQMVTNDNPWVHRGGDCNSGVLAGQLRFAVTTGGVDNYATSRLVLAN